MKNHQDFHHLKIKFLELYDQHYAGVYRFLRVKLPNDQIAQDIVSEAFVKCWNAILKNPDNYPDNDKAYLYRIAYNTLKDHYRTKNREVQVGEDDIIGYLDKKDQADSPAFDVANEMDTSVEVKKIYEALKEMSEDAAELITLRYIEDMGNKEIAKILGKSEGAVRTGLSRAMKELREKLEK